MNVNNQPNQCLEPNSILDRPEQIILEVNQVPNALLQRLMAEVKNDQANDMFAYDRAHNRHNRS